MEPKKVLFLSHTPDDGIFKVGSHHLARELSSKGLLVAHVSTPRSLVHKVLGRAAGKSSWKPGDGTLRHDAAGTLHVSPMFTLPLQIHPGGRNLGRLIRRIGFADADFILVDQPLMSAYITACRPSGRVIYRPTDTYSTYPAASRQVKITAASDGVVATSAEVLTRLHLKAEMPTLVLENGVELDRFDSSLDAVRTGFIYVGAVDYRFDWDSVIAIAEANPAQSVNIVGPITRQPDKLPTNIILSGSRSYAEVPALLRSARVGLIPLNGSSVNAGRSPMKYYEYLASGLSVLATSTPALRDRGSAQVFLYNSSAEAQVLSRAALEAPSPNVIGIQEARGQNWSAKADALLSFLESL